MCIPGNYMPHTPLGILDIPLVTGNDVNMGMQDTLPGRRPYVNADVVAIGIKLLVQHLALLSYQRHTGGNLFGRQLEKARNMAFRDNHRMTRAHREIGISRTISKFVLQ